MKTSDSGSPGEQSDFVVYHSQAKVASFAALFLLILPVMPYMFFSKVLPRHDGRVVWMAVFTVCLILFFGFAFYAAARLLLALRSPQPKPALVINDRGFLDQSKIGGGIGWVSWEEVDTVYIEPSGRFLCITLKDEEAYYRKRQSRVARLNRWLRRISPEGAPLGLMNMMLPLSLTELLAQMLKYQARHLDNQHSQ